MFHSVAGLVRTRCTHAEDDKMIAELNHELVSRSFGLFMFPPI
jgi:hypothetical protein